MSKKMKKIYSQEQEEMSRTLHIEDNFRAEFVRKLVHFISLAFPVIYFFTSRKLAIQILLPLTLVILFLDIAKNYHRPSAEIFYRTFAYILRRYERIPEMRRLNGITSFLLAASISTIAFPKYVTIMSFVLMTFSDAASALVGRRYGITKIMGRSLEGSLAFVITAVLVVLITPKIEYRLGEYLICSLAAVVGAVAEILSGDAINDNFTIPLSIGAALWLFYFLVYPSMNIALFGAT